MRIATGRRDDDDDVEELSALVDDGDGDGDGDGALPRLAMIQGRVSIFPTQNHCLHTE